MGIQYPAIISPRPGFRLRVQEYAVPYSPPSLASIMLGSYLRTAPFVKSEQTQSLISEIALLLRRLEQKGLRIPRPGSVYDYLIEYPDLLGVVEQVVDIALGRLPDALFSLEVYYDVEIEDKYLVLFARFNRYDTDILKELDSVEDDCLGLLEGKKGVFLVTTDFNSPE